MQWTGVEGMHTLCFKLCSHVVLCITDRNSEIFGFLQLKTCYCTQGFWYHGHELLSRGDQLRPRPLHPGGDHRHVGRSLLGLDHDPHDGK